MTTIETIRRVLTSGIIELSLIDLPPGGATNEKIKTEEISVGRTFSPQHVQFLRNWNGIHLDIVNFYGCGPDFESIRGIAGHQHGIQVKKPGWLIIGDDPAGFLYAESQDGGIYSIDTKGGGIKKKADNLDDFISRVVFGPDAESFAGEDWAREVKETLSGPGDRHET